MKKIIVFIIVIAIMLSFAACSKDESVAMAESLIASIGDTTIENENAVIFAENFYNTLSDSQKAKVSNYEILLEARNSIDQAKAEEERRIAEEKAAEEERIEKERAAEEARIKQEEEERRAAEEAAKEAEEAARKAEEERKAYEDSIPPAPLSISNIRVKDYYSAKEIYVQFTNTGKENIEAFDFYVICYDAYGNIVTHYSSEMQVCTYDDVLKPGQTTQSNWCWKFYNMSTTKTVKVAVFKYKLAGKDAVEIPERKLIWIKQ